MNKQKMYDGILLSHTKEVSLAICSSIDEHGRQYAK
jgi:hypothetical protein